MSDAEPQQELPTEVPPKQQGSVAARASCFTFVFLLLVAISTWVYLTFWGDGIISIITGGGWIRLIVILLLLIAIPILLFRTITLWMMRGSSKYPDIEIAWKAGIAALEQNNMSLFSAPIYLVFGGMGPNARKNFIHASGLQFRVDSVPNGPAPFHWYANSDMILISFNDVSWLHAACLLSRQPRTSPQASRPAAAVQDMSRTITPGEINLPSAAAEAASQQQAPAADNFAHLRGTIVPPSFSGPAPSASVPNRPAPSAARVDSETSTKLLNRLQHVCGLLRNGRHPVCPVNGMLTLIPYEILQNNQQDVKEVQRAISADMLVAQRELRLRCPVTAVVTGMEKERGFRELIRRVGPERAARQRFGQRYDVRAEASMPELTKFSRHVCSTFEDWVYTMFGENDSLTRPGNNLLFAMLCRVRRSVRTRLAEVLAGFGSRPDDKFSLIFSGCYFTGTGSKVERQAFVRGVLDKLRDEQEEVEWTDEAIAADMNLDRMTKIGWGVTAVLAMLLVGVFAFYKLGGS